VPHADHGFAAGAEVFAFARPHELRIDTNLTSLGLLAAVNRVLAFGVSARVELDGLNGATGQHFEVELTQQQVEQLALQPLQHVRLVPSRLKLFERNAISQGAQP
jgi:sulfate transport system ATP-binding protein